MIAGFMAPGLVLPYLQIAVRRPLNKFMTSTTNPTTRSKWIRPPPICRLKPRSHKIRRTTRTVQSMATLMSTGLIRSAACTCSRLARSQSAMTSEETPVFPRVRAALLLAAVTDHGQIRDRHVTVLGVVFIHAVLLHLSLGVFLHPVGCGV